MSPKDKVLTVLSGTLYMIYCGCHYVIGTTSPYFASYFRVEPSKVQLILPAIILL